MISSCIIFCIFADPYTFNTYKLLLVPSLDNVVDVVVVDDDDDDDLSTSEDCIT
jgi:hypothetical protein